MKKYFLLIAVFSISLGALAQKGKVNLALSLIEQGALDKAKEAIDQALEHDKSKDWFNTYYAQGKLCEAVFLSDNPDFQEYYPSPLQEAYASYKKGLELDEKDKLRKRMITTMTYNSLAANLYNQGSTKFSEQDYEGALESFETQIEIALSDLYVGMADTGMYYNAGLAAINSGQYNDAIKYFEKCTEMKYEGITPYYQLYESYLGLGDTVKAESILMGLEDEFPDDDNVILNLIDLYIKAKRNEEALKYIEVAKENDPGNANIYFAAGAIYLSEERFDEAIAELKKADELEPNVFDTQYAIGAAYVNKAASMVVKANEIMDVEKYKAAIDEANKVYGEALPYMERANELQPDDFFTLRGLQELYYRLQEKEKYEEVKAKADSIEAAGGI
jgi:tetratricopeptide (TPR) repeat protein